MPANLTNNNISTTYQGLLHFDAALPTTGFWTVYDGVGNTTGLQLSRDHIYSNSGMYAQWFSTRNDTSGVPYLSIAGNQINSGIQYPEVAINYNRSDGNVGGFTDATIFDGKRAEVARFQGSTKNLLVKGDIIAFSTSDKNLKDDVKNIENPLDKVSKLNGVTFTWNDKQESYRGTDIGVIAQEVEEIIPEAVTTRDNGYKAVKYEKIIPLLIESIKELKDKNEALEAKLAAITQ
jgi:hypothetical protein